MRRICLVGAAVAASSLAFGGVASIAGAKGKPQQNVTKVTCKLQLSVTVPSGATAVTPPAAQGTLVGSSKCGKALGGGVFWNPFTLQDAGDMTGPFKQYSDTGTIRGTIDLAQSDTSGPPTAYSFGNADLTGTEKITGGTGTLAKTKGTGTLVCSTDDSVHYSCVEHLKLKLAA